ncbi:hypothetical protein [Pontiella desulfatans]|uniref:hypothetical protein n=1 Tax=Pontiella desulfatans TaxID=2750659 RepID=UPI001443BB51|nr:hypothetical protein [Pontiella desulfatans]
MNERTARAENASVPLGVNGLRFLVLDGSAGAWGIATFWVFLKPVFIPKRGSTGEQFHGVWADRAIF